MKTLSLKLDDSVFTDTEQVISHIKKLIRHFYTPRHSLA